MSAEPRCAGKTAVKKVPLGTRVISVLATPFAPFLGLGLSYMLFHPPARAHHKKASDFGLPDPEDLRVPIGGGKHIDAWLCHNDPRRLVVIGHGIGLSKSASLRHAKFLYDAGYTVCLFDHRNHGRSSRDRSLVGLSDTFTTDVVTLVRALQDRPEYASAKVAVYGFSFSTFPVSYILRDDSVRIDAVICDSGPGIELVPIFRNFLDAGLLPLPKPFTVQPARFGVEKVLCAAAPAMLRAEWPPPVSENYTKVPMLFMAAGDDRLLPPSSIEAFAELYPRTEVHVLPGVDHLQGMKEEPEKYSSTVLDFLSRVLD